MRVNADGAGIDQLGKYHCNSCAVLPFKIKYMVLHMWEDNSEVFKPVFALLTNFFFFFWLFCCITFKYIKPCTSQKTSVVKLWIFVFHKIFWGWRGCAKHHLLYSFTLLNCLLPSRSFRIALVNRKYHCKITAVSNTWCMMYVHL